MEARSFEFVNIKGHRVNIVLEPGRLVIAKESEVKTVDFQDFVGVLLSRKGEQACQIDIYYAKEKTTAYKKHNIEALKEKFFISLSLFEKDEVKAGRFRSEAMDAFYRFSGDQFKATTLPGRAVAYYKKALVIINPHAGNKKGKSNFEDTKKILEANGVYMHVVLSKPNRFCYHYIKDLPLEELLSYDFLICVSGDGIPHELLNGYMERGDLDQRQHPLTLALLPAGSGCALSENCTKMRHFKNTYSNCLFSICHYKAHQFQLQKYNCLSKDGSRHVIWGFLNFLFGFFADVDIESEFLRFMGHLRFDVYGVWRYLAIRDYSLKFFYARDDQQKLPPIDQDIPLDGPFGCYSGKSYSFYCSSLPYFSKNYLSSPALAQNNGKFDIQILPQSIGRKKLFQYLMDHTDYKYKDKYDCQHFLLKEFRLIIEEPENKKSDNIDIDGESYKWMRLNIVQGEITDYKINVIN